MEIPVADADLPQIIMDRSDTIAYNGELFRFDVEVIDNINISSVEEVFIFTEGEPEAVP